MSVSITCERVRLAGREAVRLGRLLPPIGPRPSLDGGPFAPTSPRRSLWIAVRAHRAGLATFESRHVNCPRTTFPVCGLQRLSFLADARAVEDTYHERVS